MIMDLPENVKEVKFKKIIVGYIEDGVLKIRNISAFKRVVYELTFLKKGKHKCFYCGEVLKNKKATMDHLYPQNMGGPTLVDNLVPACSKCNSEKSNLTLEEYQEFMKINRASAKKEYWKNISEKKEELRRAKKYQIPDEWICEKEISKIFLEIRLKEPTETQEYKKVEKYFKEYGYFQRPIIIDKNGFLLYGYYNVICAKTHNIQTLPAIQIENVEVIF